MNSVNSPTTPISINVQTAMGHFEEEKTFFGTMFVVITPPRGRRLSRRKSRKDREREMSSLGKVIRRYRIQGAALHKNSSGQQADDTRGCE